MPQVAQLFGVNGTYIFETFCSGAESAVGEAVESSSPNGVEGNRSRGNTSDRASKKKSLQRRKQFKAKLRTGIQPEASRKIHTNDRRQRVKSDWYNNGSICRTGDGTGRSRSRSSVAQWR